MITSTHCRRWALNKTQTYLQAEKEWSFGELPTYQVSKSIIEVENYFRKNILQSDCLCFGIFPPPPQHPQRAQKTLQSTKEGDQGPGHFWGQPTAPTTSKWLLSPLCSEQSCTQSPAPASWMFPLNANPGYFYSHLNSLFKLKEVQHCICLVQAIMFTGALGKEKVKINSMLEWK